MGEVFALVAIFLLMTCVAALFGFLVWLRRGD
jgi:hypothetical protein